MTSHDNNIIPLQLIKMLAAGAQGKVFQAKRTDTEETVAVKSILLDLDKVVQKAQIALLRSKFDVITELSHPNLVHHIHNQETALTGTFDPPTYQIIMEFCEGGTLHDLVRKTAVSPLLLQKWTKQVVEGVAYLHEQRCVHRDIKGQNILMTSTDINLCDIKIADLGDVKRLLKEATQTKEVSHEKGTWAFMSPEMITGEIKETEQMGEKGRLGRRTDVWSLGCLVIEMVKGALPDFHKTANGKQIKVNGDMAVMYFVGTGGSPTIPEGLPEPIKKFVQTCLQRDPNSRPWATDLKSHPMLTANAATVSSWVLPARNPP